MAKRGDPEVLKHVVWNLRFLAGMSQEEFGEESGISQPEISDFENGKKAPREDQLRRMARPAGADWSLVAHLRRFFGALVASRKRSRSTFPRWNDPRFKPAIVQPALLAEIPYLLEERAAAAERQTPEEALREAEEVWKALEPLPMSERRRRLGFSLRASRSWALAVTICHASARKAAHSSQEALELAELALFIAGQVPDEEFRPALEGSCRIYLANARRVGNDFAGADADFARAAELRKMGADPEGLLPERRMLDLEASLRREQHRFAEALGLLEQAFTLCGDDPLAKARILLKKEHVFSQMGDLVGALAILDEAAPWVEAAQDSHLLFALRFNRADNLAHLENYAEVAKLLPAVRELAEQQGNDLDGLRLDWLEAKALAGLGKKPKAMLRLEQVQRDFTKHELPYDAALSSLDLAVLWLEAGRTAEVQQLAVAMEWIFRHQGIEREALATLKLFCDAAKQEAATVDLARQVIADIEKVRRLAPRKSREAGAS